MFRQFFYHIMYIHVLSVVIPLISLLVSYFSFKLTQIKFENDKSGFDEAQDFQRLEKMNNS